MRRLDFQSDLPLQAIRMAETKLLELRQTLNLLSNQVFDSWILFIKFLVETDIPIQRLSSDVDLSLNLIYLWTQ